MVECFLHVWYCVHGISNDVHLWYEDTIGGTNDCTMGASLVRKKLAGLAYSGYLVTDGHIGLALVVCAAQICPLVPIHESQAVKAFHCVCGQSPMIGHIVLGSI